MAVELYFLVVLSINVSRHNPLESVPFHLRNSKNSIVYIKAQKERVFRRIVECLPPQHHAETTFKSMLNNDMRVGLR